MWALVWRPAPIRWRGFARIRAESVLSISKTGHRNRRRVIQFCSVKVLQSGKTFSKQPKVRVEWSITYWSRKAAGFPNSRPHAAACSPSGSCIQHDDKWSGSFVLDGHDWWKKLEPRVGVEPTTCGLLRKLMTLTLLALSCVLHRRFAWYSGLVGIVFLRRADRSR